MDQQLQKLLEKNRDWQTLLRARQDLAASRSDAETIAFAWDGLETNLARLWSNFFASEASQSRLAERAVRNDSFTTAIIHLDELISRTSSQNERSCLDLVSKILVEIGAQSNSPVSEIQVELLLAYYLALGIRNTRLARPVLEGPKPGLASSEVLGKLGSVASLEELAANVISVLGINKAGGM